MLTGIAVVVALVIFTILWLGIGAALMFLTRRKQQSASPQRNKSVLAARMAVNSAQVPEAYLLVVPLILVWSLLWNQELATALQGSVLALALGAVLVFLVVPNE